MSDPYDFQIGDLKFRAAISDKFPYQRGTAQFRKEQFDSAPTVGDQSLSGWWTRGQLSFHKGAGVKYYEVLEGEEILNRFQDSSKMEWRTPGRVSLRPDTERMTTDVWVAANTPAVMDPPAKVGPSAFAVDTNGTNRILEFYARPLGGSQPDPVEVALVGTDTPVTLCAGASSDDYLWVATDGNNVQRLTISSTYGAHAADGVYYTHTKAIAALTWAKNRLWILDVDGDLFAVSGAPASVPEVLGSANASLGRRVNQQGFASFAEASTGIYVSAGDNIVWRVGIEDAGGTPTYAAAVETARLPGGDSITAILAHLGHLVISLSAGKIVVASIAPDGALTYGPPMAEQAMGAYCRSMAASGTSVYFTGHPLDPSASGLGGTGVVYEVNLAEPSDQNPLVFAWGAVDEFDCYDTGQPTGVVSASADGWGFTAWDYRNLITVTQGSTGTSPALIPRAAQGGLLTGLHRFGTLDGKHFQEVLVRSEGGGTIEVWRLDADGTETQLIALSGVREMRAGATDAPSRTFPVGLSGPSEAIGLRFVLNRDEGDTTLGPTLLGYQLKALPSPKRQRLIKVPVVAADIIRGRHGVDIGKRGAAYENWMRLEAMEEDDALVTFTDLRTGETGDVYIESVELQTDTPARNGEAGFGGIGYITLRKVSPA